tara:strand:- start:908 stop:1105 length:198 start_codon:yes stop_codon:yes gene_type:complete
MNYKQVITATFNQALIKQLRRESKTASKERTAIQASNSLIVMKRRYTEDMALAKHLGVTIQELTE